MISIQGLTKRFGAQTAVDHLTWEVPPGKIVQQGPYRFTRNPMYLGHIIFLIGLAVTFWSWFALILLAARATWFHCRVLRDESRLEQRFGDDYAIYRSQVRRWIPGII